MNEAEDFSRESTIADIKWMKRQIKLHRADAIACGVDPDKDTAAETKCLQSFERYLSHLDFNQSNQ